MPKFSKIRIFIFLTLLISIGFSIPHFSHAQTEGTVYVCPEVASMEEVNPRCPGKIILKLGETINGLTLTTTTYEGQEYYLVLGFTNGGGGVNLPPVADANGSYQGDAGLPITLDASNSSDPNSDPLQYRWDFDDDGIWDTEWLSASAINHIWNNDYEGNVELEVSDGEFSAIDTAMVKIKSPRAFKQDVVQELENIETIDKHSQKNIEKAIDFLAKSLESSLWLDSSHLDSKHGHKVFDQEKHTIEELLKIIEKRGKHTDQAIIEKVQFAINKIIEADVILAEVAVLNAENAPVQDPKFLKKVNQEIEKAEKELAKARKELEKNEPDKAIDHLKKAWEYAQSAIEFANPGNGS